MRNLVLCAIRDYSFYVSATTIEISIDTVLLKRVDQVVNGGSIPTRDHLVQQALSEKIMRLDTAALAQECARLNPSEEQAMADEGLKADAASWPKY